MIGECWLGQAERRPNTIKGIALDSVGLNRPEFVGGLKGFLASHAKAKKPEPVSAGSE